MVRIRDHKLEYAIKIVKKHLGVDYKVRDKEINVPANFKRETAHPQLIKHMDFLIGRGWNMQRLILSDSRYPMIPIKEVKKKEATVVLNIDHLIKDIHIHINSTGGVVGAMPDLETVAEEAASNLKELISERLIQAVKETSFISNKI